LEFGDTLAYFVFHSLLDGLVCLIAESFQMVLSLFNLFDDRLEQVFQLGVLL